MKNASLLFVCLLYGLAKLATSLGDVPSVANVPVERENHSGPCSTDLTWVLDDETGTLTISGTGTMVSFASGSVTPWESVRSKIKVVKINSGVGSIGGSAFSDLPHLVSVSIPSSVGVIGYRAFYNCTALSSVDISEEGLKTIEQFAFESCVSLTSVKIPRTVTKISESDSFPNCSSMTSIEVMQPNSVYESSDGVLINKNTKTIMKCPNGKKGVFIVPSSVNTINNRSFSFSNLTSVIIPDSVTLIKNEAFYSSILLKSVIYHGFKDPGKNSNRVFYLCDAMKIICLPVNYSQPFCGGIKSKCECKSPSCEEVLQQQNYCYEVSIVSQECVVTKRSNWSNLESKCGEYQCENSTGLVSFMSMCNESNAVCVNDSCYSKDESMVDDNESVTDDKSVVVIIETETLSPVNFTLEEVTEQLSNMTAIEVDELLVTVEYDDNGNIVRLIVHVVDRFKADLIVNLTIACIAV